MKGHDDISASSSLGTESKLSVLTEEETFVSKKHILKRFIDRGIWNYMSLLYQSKHFLLIPQSIVKQGKIWIASGPKRCKSIQTFFRSLREDPQEVG